MAFCVLFFFMMLKRVSKALIKITKNHTIQPLCLEGVRRLFLTKKTYRIWRSSWLD